MEPSWDQVLVRIQELVSAQGQEDARYEGFEICVEAHGEELRIDWRLKDPLNATEFEEYGVLIPDEE